MSRALSSLLVRVAKEIKFFVRLRTQGEFFSDSLNKVGLAGVFTKRTDVRVIYTYVILFGFLLHSGICHALPSVVVRVDYTKDYLAVVDAARDKKLSESVRRDDINCPDNAAVRVWGGPHDGAYVACENFDEYQELMDLGRADSAEKILLVHARKKDK